MRRAGVSYFGVRIPRHARRDLEDIAARGYTAVLHTFSENDLAYYRGTMAEIVAGSHELGLEVQMCPWGVGRTFGGEAESRWVTFHPEACQVLDEGRCVAAGCLNNPAYRAFCKEWADAALEAGTDYVFWDEPHWTVPEHVGVDDPERWACVCQICAELSGLDLTQGLTPDEGCQPVNPAWNAAFASRPRTAKVTLSSDRGSKLRVSVTATNAAGSAQAASTRTAAVDVGAPASESSPTMTGTFEQGATVTGSIGQWTGGDPLSYSYQWQRCGERNAVLSAAPIGYWRLARVEERWLPDPRPAPTLH